MDQLQRDHYFMDIARAVAAASTCSRRKVGAVLVKDNHILSAGYNGAPSSLPHCIDDPGECIRTIMQVPSGKGYDLCVAAHAELNAIVFAARHGISMNGSTLYTTFGPPCGWCAKYIINSGVIRVVYRDTVESLQLVGNLFRHVGIELIQLPKAILCVVGVGNPNEPKIS